MTQYEAPPPETVLVIEEQARAFARKGLKRGLELENIIRVLNEVSSNRSPECASKLAKFAFLKPHHRYHPFYRAKFDEYIAQHEAGTLPPPPDPPAALLPSDLVRPPERKPPPPCCYFSLPKGISLPELGLIKLTAQFVARYGFCFWHDLLRRVMTKHPNQFSFLRESDERFYFYQGLVVLYQRVLSPPSSDDISMDTVLDAFLQLAFAKPHEFVDLLAFSSGLDCFLHMDEYDYSAKMPTPLPLSRVLTDLPPALTPDPTPPPLLPPPPSQGPPKFHAHIPLLELGVVKLTAMFVARYGNHFHQALLMRVLMNPMFQFLFFPPDPSPQFQRMEPAEVRFHVFSRLSKVYSKIFLPSEKLLKRDPSFTETVLAIFFQRLHSLEEGSAIDLHAFASGADYFAYMDERGYSFIMPPPQRLSVMINQPTHDTLVQLPLSTPSSYHYQSQLFLHQFRSLTNLAVGFPQCITHKDLGIIKLTAQFAAWYGYQFQDELAKSMATEPEFEFLKPTDGRFSFYRAFHLVYSSIVEMKKSDDCGPMALDLFIRHLQLKKLQKGEELAMIEVHVFTSALDCFTHMDYDGYSATMPPPQRLSTMMNSVTQMHPDMLVRPLSAQPDDNQQVTDAPATRECVVDAQTGRAQRYLSGFGGITPEEFGIIKITAMFVTRYGMLFCRDIIKRVIGKPQFKWFKFMEPSNERFRIYKSLVDKYSKVLKARYELYSETVLKRYFDCVQLEKLEAGLEIVKVDLFGKELNDLDAFVAGLECFAHCEEMLHARTTSEEPERKRMKLDESAQDKVLF